MGCCGNPKVVSDSVLYNILYCIVESFSLIHGRRHGWPNHVKTSYTICVIVLSLCSLTNIVGIKAFVGTTIGGGECHKMLQMTLPMVLYRRWEASRDPWRHLHLATKWKSMEAFGEG